MAAVSSWCCSFAGPVDVLVVGVKVLAVVVVIPHRYPPSGTGLTRCGESLDDCRPDAPEGGSRRRWRECGQAEARRVQPARLAAACDITRSERTASHPPRSNA